MNSTKHRMCIEYVHYVFNLLWSWGSVNPATLSNLICEVTTYAKARLVWLQ